MPNNLPLKLTQAQAVDMKARVLEIEKDFTKRGLDFEVVRLELALVCARYAINAGVLDQYRLPPETNDQIQHTHPSSSIYKRAALGCGHAASGGAALGTEDHDDGG